MKILFVCSANQHRSKTAEDYFSAKFPEEEFQSAGTNHKICKQKGTTPLDQDLMDWADVVYVMENKHKEQIQKHVGSLYNEKITVLNIPDDFKYYQKELIALLEEKFFPPTLDA
jgi:predicted protein tyrosine phosphatase